MTITLTFRFGKVRRTPSAAEMRTALDEIYNEQALSCATSDLEEHPNSWLTLGYEQGDKWAVVTLDVYRTGDVRLTKYEDQDDDEPVYELLRQEVGYEECFAMWRSLAAGDESGLLSSFRAVAPN